MSKDYYQILGVNKTATKDEIKTAFRKLAHQYHPDKAGGNEAKFKEVSEAYNVLVDETKRQQYDMYGSAGSSNRSGYGGFGGFRQGQDFGGFDFSQFTQGGGNNFEFDLGDIFGEFFGGTRRQRVRKGQDISVDLEITFAESVFGVEKEFSLTRNSTHKAEKIKVKIPADINNGETIRLTGAGEPINDGVAGDLYINISVRRDSLFKKEGKNIITEINIKLSDALLGLKYKLKTIDGEIILTVPEGVNNGNILRVRDKGVPIDSRRRGDLLVKINVIMPDRLSKNAKKVIEELKKEGL